MCLCWSLVFLDDVEGTLAELNSKCETAGAEKLKEEFYFPVYRFTLKVWKNNLYIIGRKNQKD